MCLYEINEAGGQNNESISKQTDRRRKEKKETLIHDSLLVEIHDHR